MSDEIKAAGIGCCDRGYDNDWIEWIVIIFVIFWLLGGNSWFGRGGCCR